MNALQTPLAIVIAGSLIAFSIVFSAGNSTVIDGSVFGNSNSSIAQNVNKVSESDHVYGNVNGKILIVEYSDFECPFCSKAHPTFEKIVMNYDNVAWVYRHFPLTSIHSRAQRASVASECVAELAGNDAFWIFTKTLFEKQKDLSDKLYEESAIVLGVDPLSFRECIESGRHDLGIQEDLQNAIDSGGKGTPFSIIINGKGETFPFSGALQYEQVKSIIDNAISSS